MFVKFAKELPGLPHKVGEVVEFPDAIGRSYVDGGYGAETSVSEHLQARQAAAFADLKAELTRTIQEAAKTAPKPPVHRGGVEFEGSVSGASTPADRAKKHGVGDIIRCMYFSKAYGDDPRVTESMHKYGVQTLDHILKLQRTEWSEDGGRGIARDGAESGPLGAPTYGYLVAPTYVQDVFKIGAEDAVMANLRQVPVGNGVEAYYPAIDQYTSTTPTRTSNLFGGVVAYRKGEADARTAVDAKTVDIEFKITDLTLLTKLSRDLMADSFVDMNGFIQGLFGDALAWRKDWDYLNGTGVGEPLGIYNAPAMYTNGPASSKRTASGKILYEDVAWMLSRVWPGARLGGYWIANAQAASQLMALVASSPAAFAYQPNALITQGQLPSVYAGQTWQGMLLGYPLKFSEKAPSLDTDNDIVFINPQYYGEAMRQGIEVGISEHRYFENDQIGIRWKLRNDAKPLQKKVIIGADGNTYSAFVGLKKF